MTGIFLRIVNMSIQAGYLILAILLIRLFLKKAPRWIAVLLWGIAAVRLICPFSVGSIFSLLPSAQTITPDIMLSPEPKISTGLPFVNQALNPIIVEVFSPEPGASVNPLQILIPIFTVIWLIGISGLLIYTIVSYERVKRRIGAAEFCGDNIYRSQSITSPFVLGIIKPKIYLPSFLSETDTALVSAHEQAHIARKDHLWKPLGFLLLTLHWFNPLVWVGYVLLCRDIEIACDEKVIKSLDRDARADYSQALLTCSVTRRLITACPLAFGEVGVKERVRSVLNYKKPSFWIIIAALIVCAVTAVCFLTVPEEYQIPWDQFCISYPATPITLSPKDKDHIKNLMNHGKWSSDTVTCTWDYKFCFQMQTVKYSSTDGVFWDDVKKKHLTVTEKEKESINKILAAADKSKSSEKVMKALPASTIHCPDRNLSLKIIENNLFEDASGSIIIEWENLGDDVFTLLSCYSVYHYQDGRYLRMPESDCIDFPLDSIILSVGGSWYNKAEKEYDLSMFGFTTGDAYRLYLNSTGESEYWVDFIYGVPFFDISSLIIDTADMDIDGDGMIEKCTMYPGPTSGLFTVVIAASVNGSAKYRNTFVLSWCNPQFDNTDGVPGILLNDGKHRLSVTDNCIIIDGLNADYEGYWGSQDFNTP